MALVVCHSVLEGTLFFLYLIQHDAYEDITMGTPRDIYCRKINKNYEKLGCYISVMKCFFVKQPSFYHVPISNDKFNVTIFLISSLFWSP